MYTTTKVFQNFTFSLPCCSVVVGVVYFTYIVYKYGLTVTFYVITSVMRSVEAL